MTLTSIAHPDEVEATAVSEETQTVRISDQLPFRFRAPDPDTSDRSDLNRENRCSSPSDSIICKHRNLPVTLLNKSSEHLDN